MASASRTLVCATAKPTAGAAAAISRAPAAPTDVATPRQALAAASPAGGRLRAAAGASATKGRCDAIRPRAPACARRAGGATAAVSDAPATAHRARRIRAVAPVCQAGGARSAGTGVSACAAAAAPPQVSARARPASAACAASCSARRATTGRSAATGEPGAGGSTAGVLRAGERATPRSRGRGVGGAKGEREETRECEGRARWFPQKSKRTG